jgi:hypothetical protein
VEQEVVCVTLQVVTASNVLQISSGQSLKHSTHVIR